MSQPKVQPITLHIAHVGIGGNTDDGKYFYRCEPNLINITEKDTPIQFVLADDAKKRFDIKHMFSSDSFDQIGIPEYALDKKSLEFVHSNTHRSLTFFSIVAYDTTLHHEVNCDPQATNVPQ